MAEVERSLIWVGGCVLTHSVLTELRDLFGDDVLVANAVALYDYCPVPPQLFLRIWSAFFGRVVKLTVSFLLLTLFSFGLTSLVVDNI